MVYKAKDLLEKLLDKKLVGVVDGELIFEELPERERVYQQDIN